MPGDAPTPRDHTLPPLPVRDAAGHKGTFGTVCVVGGCAAGQTRMFGAPALTAMAALRSGAGLARIAAPLPVLDAAISLCPGATGVGLATDAEHLLVPHEAAAAIDELVTKCDCLAIGPGLGAGEGGRAASLRAVQQEEVPVVVDADAINALSEIPQLTRDLRGAVVLTPHPGEYSCRFRAIQPASPKEVDPLDPLSRRVATRRVRPNRSSHRFVPRKSPCSNPCSSA